MSLKLNKLITTMLGRFKDAAVSIKMDAEVLSIAITIPGPRYDAVLNKQADLFEVGLLGGKELRDYWDKMLNDFITEGDAAVRRQSVSIIPPTKARAS
jgi:hypothetical protein